MTTRSKSPTWRRMSSRKYVEESSSTTSGLESGLIVAGDSNEIDDNTELKTLYDPAEKNHRTELDIICIHGLGPCMATIPIMAI
ncbi:hypothetical protein NPX13_g354 [Xylaria arbuscula]|uniref:Uncharacterized protein n=1 Tax=Xylaria arbuscula TaxID=114810 RepID=A0A9W8NNP9_9PEZI|nr:hypothetical protein NPX13_g354 [Xylaria arbuscula]